MANKPDVARIATASRSVFDSLSYLDGRYDDRLNGAGVRPRDAARERHGFFS